MAQTVGIGNQDFEVIRTRQYFYIDKTRFIREWWERGDSVTLITRPRRFGKTLNMSMLEKFFSVQYAGRGELFEGLEVWESEKFRKLQGTYHLIFISFADVKENTYPQARKKLCSIIRDLYRQYRFLTEGDLLSEEEKREFQSISADMEDYMAAGSIKALSGHLFRYYDRRVIILLDEYDTPMQEAYVNGYWKEMVAFTRSLFNSAFKTNPYLERAIMIGITRVSKESIFSDLNNLEVVTATSEIYADCFGFTEEEAFLALDAYGLSERKQEVKAWYDGFTFGKRTDIYNPWSILNYIDKRKLASYWINSSSNSLIGKLIQEGGRGLKAAFGQLLRGETITTEMDEQIVFDQLDQDDQAVWSLLVASGYLKVKRLQTYTADYGEWKQEYELEITNFEVRMMFRNMVRKWFSGAGTVYNDFIKALLVDDIRAMNVYMNKVALTTFSYFDTGNRPSGAEPERFHGVEATTKGLKEPNPSVCFYHGFVLGLMVELADRYVLTSNRESGFGRYDVMLEPRRQEDDGIILEFKVQDPEEEKELADTVKAALDQIEEKQYETMLVEKGVPRERIRKYGFAFRGNTVMIGQA
ncbi:MAG: AAA family ATPase [Lachnospiraceae bacterium]|nr:AAA family ATPase [Lachnospiraceae bacterium]